MDQERRAHARLAQEEHVKVDVIAEENPREKLTYDCFSRDLSENGIRIHGASSFQLGTDVNLLVHMKSHEKNYKLEGTIKWLTETTEHEVLAGIEFNESRSPDIESWRSLFQRN